MINTRPKYYQPIFSNNLNDLNNSLEYYKHLKTLLEAHETKAKSIIFRKNLIEHQHRINYTNEIDRLRGEATKTNAPYHHIEQFYNRIKNLKELGGEIVDKIK